jgi:hypothetical protein
MSSLCFEKKCAIALVCLVQLFMGGDAVLNVVAIESPPFICTELLPCAPAIEADDEAGQGNCIYGGIRAQGGVCLHGYLIDLLLVLSAPDTGNMSFILWHTTSSVTKGYNNLVREVFSPGSVLSSPICGNATCDIALGDITINWPRRRLVRSRFSAPYMTAGLQILGRTKQPARSVNFDFMQPFAPRLWALILFTLLFMTFAIVFVEAPNFRAKFVYLRPDSSSLSWQEKSMSR